jgi:small subunit ribosomal protein S13
VARISGVDLPRDKRVPIGLTYIYGIGHTTAENILAEAGIDPSTRIHALTDEQLTKLRNIIESNYKVEGSLRGEIQINIKRLMDVGSYRGLRHRRGLPVRGQRTRTNARTRKGPRRSVAGSKNKGKV